MSQKSHHTHCPCQKDTNLEYPHCCGLYIDQKQIPMNAEILMRSGYTAYVMENQEYLLQTWHPSTRPMQLDFEPTKWIGLTVHSHTQSDETHAQVTFSARYKVNGKAFKMHECSSFIQEYGQWFYIDGDY